VRWCCTHDTRGIYKKLNEWINKGFRNLNKLKNTMKKQKLYIMMEIKQKTKKQPKEEEKTMR